MLQTLHQKVAEVYTRCIGGNEATISTLQMLTAIETRLEELFETVEGLPADKVETAEKVCNGHSVCVCCVCVCVCVVLWGVGGGLDVVAWCGGVYGGVNWSVNMWCGGVSVSVNMWCGGVSVSVNMWCCGVIV